MNLLWYALIAYVLISLFVGVMIHFKRGAGWVEAMKDGFTWPKLIPEMWS